MDVISKAFDCSTYSVDHGHVFMSNVLFSSQYMIVMISSCMLSYVRSWKPLTVLCHYLIVLRAPEAIHSSIAHNILFRIYSYSVGLLTSITDYIIQNRQCSQKMLDKYSQLPPQALATSFLTLPLLGACLPHRPTWRGRAPALH